MSRRSMWAAGLVALICVAPLLADGPQTGTIDGRVLDAQGAPLPGVTVTLTGPQNTRTVITDADGVYRFALLLAGRYTVNAELEGLGTAELATDLDPGQRRGVDLTLVSATAEEITVTGEAPLISRYETALAATIPEEVTDNVAFGTRAYSAAMRQLPSVVNRSEADSRPSVNGGIGTEIGVYVEGVDTSMHRRGGEMRLLIPSTALTESKLESTGFGAEYGRATSGIINSTVKTGTNEFHGEALYVGQNPKWRALNVLELERPDDQINSYETSIGGPLARNRAWFFVSYGRLSDNLIDRLSDGSIVNLSRQSDPLIAKVNFQPRDTQQIAITAIDAPSDAIGLSGNPGDQYAIMNFPLNGRVQTLNWSLGLSSSNFLEFKVANREEFVGRNPAEQHPIDPNASPDDPLGNNFRYRDLATGLRHNGPAVRLAEGFNDFPRDQANVSLTSFRGRHEWKFGVDAQAIEFANLTSIITEFRGRNFDPNLPGGYVTPVNKRVFDPSDVIRETSDFLAVFAQDRFEVGDNWVWTLGIRGDQQTIDNDVGERVNEYTEWVPRISGVYDVKADGSILLRGTLGRYYHAIGMGIVLQEFSRQNNGENIYEQFAWNRETLRYDRFQRRVEPTFDQAIQDVDPYYKDEISFGADFQVSEKWVVKSRLIASEADNIFHATLQYDDAGRVVRDLRNWPDARREYRGLQIEANRLFRDNWTLRTNYTLSSTEGNINSLNDNFNLYEGLGGIEVGTGLTNATSSPYWFGRLLEDREHLANVVGMKRFVFGRHDLVLGGFLRYASGAPWASHVSTQVRHPVSNQPITTSTFREPAGSHRLPDTWTVDLSLMYSIATAGNVRAKIGFDLANATDSQEPISINTQTGVPRARVSSYQRPREFRLKVGFSF
ncbi:MAG: TonB-dependent receptor [Acidobacteriota bacterium]|nr:TonB-dependent receptor [Acidobacteriota bacterium]MDE2922650.1 TonB-dependent receptor [Acidobacteriota bacterium]MDE3265607.1 TonB-dependent receptor [Acidobacteriota bacterium]